MFRCVCGHKLREHEPQREDGYVLLPCGECDCRDYQTQNQILLEES